MSVLGGCYLCEFLLFFKPKELGISRTMYCQMLRKTPSILKGSNTFKTSAITAKQLRGGKHPPKRASLFDKRLYFPTKIESWIDYI